MGKAKRKLYVFCDMEGASQISRDNVEAMRHGSDLWRREGRGFLTSDLLAVCEAALEAGVDEIVVNDAHDTGRREPNLVPADLPARVRLLGRPHLQDRARRAFRKDPWGIVMIGQHAMYGAEGFAAHTVQSPPIGEVRINGLAVSEMGMELALFPQAKFLAVVGDAAAVREAEALCPGVVGFAVKDKDRGWYPAAAETRPLIREAVARAMARRDEAPILGLSPPWRFELRPAEGWRFDPKARFPMSGLACAWFSRLHGGLMADEVAEWKARRAAPGLAMVYMLRMFLRKR